MEPYWSTTLAISYMTNVMSQRDGFNEVFVESERAADRSRHLCNFQRVSESSPVVIALRIDEHLGLVLESTKALGVQDSIPITLVNGAHRIGIFRHISPRRI